MCSGGQVVSQLNKCQSTVKTLSLLLEASLGGTSSLAALLLLCGFFLFIGLEELHGILLLLVFCSRLALCLHLGGCRGTLLTSLPVPTRTEKFINLQRQQTMTVKCSEYKTVQFCSSPVLTSPASLPQPCCPQTGLSPCPPLVPLSSNGRKDAWDSDGWRV